MKKKNIIITSVAVVIAFVVGMFVGDSMAINRVKKQFSSIGTSETTKSTVSEKAPKEEKKETKSIKLNEGAAAGDLGIKVLEAKEGTSISNEAGSSKPSGKFIIIKLELKNNGQSAIEYKADDFGLKNSKAIYEVDDNAFEALGDLNSQEKIYNENKNFVGVYDKFNAGITKNTYIVFDVPKETKTEDLKLIVKQNQEIEFNLK